MPFSEISIPCLDNLIFPENIRSIMAHNLRPELHAYYDARAHEYDEIYSGRGPAIPDPEAYKTDVKKLSEAAAFAQGAMIDIGCGTGFWLPYYSKNCVQITLVDQSAKMLRQCAARVAALGFQNKCQLVRGDFFSVSFRDRSFDSALVGFLLSHLSLRYQRLFFERLKAMLKPTAQIILIDSAWSPKRQHYRKKEEIQERVLTTGQTFTIYKRYFDQADIEEMFRRNNCKLNSLYLGDVFLAARGENCLATGVTG